MRIIILLVLLIAQSAYADAQEYITVQHMDGTEQVGNNEVTVATYGDRPTNQNFDEVSPYYIGNKGRVNGYDFSFAEPVNSVRIHLTAINNEEQIEIGINGRRYNLFERNMADYTPEYRTSVLPAIEDGIITYSDKLGMASVTITIAPGYDINSVYVHHLNGAAAGSVFDLSFATNGSLSDNIDGRSATTSTSGLKNNTQILELYPNPNTGSFVLKGDVYNNREIELEIVNAVGQKVYEQKVFPNNSSVNESLNLNSTIPNGVYMLYLKNGPDIQNIRFTIKR